jgi:prevent-host-death family protein
MSRATWQLQQAKNCLSEVVRKARSEGPQVITLHGLAAAVVVSAQDFGRMSGAKGNLVNFFRSSPLVGVRLTLTRSKDTGRAIDL